MALGVTNEFEEMKVGMGLAPQAQHPLEIKATAENTPVVQKVEVQGVQNASNTNVLDTAAIAGNNLRNDYTQNMGKTSDLAFGMKEIGKDVGELGKSLFDSIFGKKEAEPVVATPANPQLAMAEMQPAQKYVAPFGL